MNDGARELGETSAEEPVASPQPPEARVHRTTHRVRALRRRIGRGVALTVGPPLVRALSRTWRSVVSGEENVTAARKHGGGYFMPLWHGRMLIPAVRHSHQGYAVLVSASSDGDVSEAFLRKIGYGTVRGSSRRKGRTALREMLRLLRAGTPIAITPDGPSGPAHTLSGGVTWLASATGFPVVPCGFVATKAWHLPSWDRFTIPKPFTRVAYVYEEPVFVPRDDDVDLEAFSAEIKTRMMRAEKRGFELLGVEPDG